MCDSGELMASCCGPLLEGKRRAETAQALMRSRYSAFATGNTKYLLETWAPETRPAELRLDDRQRWLGLKIRRVEAGSATCAHGLVEFVARFKIDGRGHRLHEISSFRRAQTGWLYVGGEQG
ncbi:MAG: YchJ family metal-binding protein [Pseudomonadaceae bacterium]|nr:YchJ family metal-binding protein [Pseudomonadaceae bacterium]